MRRSIAVGLLALCYLDAPAAYSTTVIAIATPDGIVVGTDALVTTGSYGDVNRTGSKLVPKKIELILGNRIVVATSGIVGSSTYEFHDWIEEISKDLPKDTSVEDFVHVLERESAAKFQYLTPLLKSGKLTTPSDKFCGNLVKYLVVGYQEGHPRVYTVEFYNDWANKQLVGPITNLLTQRGSDFGIFMIGQFNAINELKNPKSFAVKQASIRAPNVLTKLLTTGNASECEVASLIRVLVKVQGDVNPDDVNGVGQLFYIPRLGFIRETSCRAAYSAKRSPAASPTISK
jgi:hypothetical protein